MTSKGASRIRARGLSLPVGTYHYDVRLDRWTVDSAVRAIVGLDDAARIDTATVLAILPSKEARTSLGFVRDALGTHAPFSSHHRLDHEGGRDVVVVGEGTYDGDGTLLSVHGQVVDVGRVSSQRVNGELDAKVAEVVANRATIEQAKGALSLAYGFDEDAAIALLRWWSSHRNVKVHSLASRLVDRAATGAVSSPELRASVDEILADGVGPGSSAESDGVH